MLVEPRYGHPIRPERPPPAPQRRVQSGSRRTRRSATIPATFLTIWEGSHRTSAPPQRHDAARRSQPAQLRHRITVPRMRRAPLTRLERLPGALRTCEGLALRQGVEHGRRPEHPAGAQGHVQLQARRTRRVSGRCFGRHRVSRFPRLTAISVLARRAGILPGCRRATNRLSRPCSKSTSSSRRRSGRRSARFTAWRSNAGLGPWGVRRRPPGRFARHALPH